jgi:hypothetical protein
MQYVSTVFPVLAPLPVENAASALAFFAFLRSFANTWGITIGSTIIQNELPKRLPREVATQLPQGTDLTYALVPLIRSLPEPLRHEVRRAFADSLRTMWYVMIGVAGLGLLSVALLKEIKMGEHKDETYALKEEPTKESDAVGA